MCLQLPHESLSSFPLHCSRFSSSSASAYPGFPLLLSLPFPMDFPFLLHQSCSFPHESSLPTLALLISSHPLTPHTEAQNLPGKVEFSLLGVRTLILDTVNSQDRGVTQGLGGIDPRPRSPQVAEPAFQIPHSKAGLFPKHKGRSSGRALGG